MQLLDSLEVTSAVGQHRIELFQGDLTNMPPEHAVDVLVLSAFPGDYSKRPGTLIGNLAEIGVDVGKLSKNKEADLREAFSCWMSKEIPTTSPRIQFDRILVFEPLTRGRPSDVVGDIFQSLMPFIYVEPYIRRVAMPVVATGNQLVAPAQILNPLIDAAVNWFQLGLPVEVIKIVEYSEKKARLLQGAFSVLKNQYAPQRPARKSRSAFGYDFFISYSHDDASDVSFLRDELTKLRPDLRVFMDTQNLKVGSAWQQELYETLDECAQVITVYSPTYLNSKVCKEEYNIALMRHREEGNVLVPIYLESADLPTYMKLIQFIDCREGDRQKLRVACQKIL